VSPASTQQQIKLGAVGVAASSTDVISDFGHVTALLLLLRLAAKEHSNASKSHECQWTGCYCDQLNPAGRRPEDGKELQQILVI